MQPLRTPFGSASRGIDVVWPPWTGPSTSNRRARRLAELWELGPGSENSAGERVLADLEPDSGRTDALLIVARYLALRVALNADRPEPDTFNESVERESAIDCLAAMRRDVTEGRWLRAVLDAAERGVSRALIARLNAAAAAADRRDHVHGAFALRFSAWEIARRNGWHAEAGRVARAIARSAERRGGRRSRRLWSRRARVHEARARV